MKALAGTAMIAIATFAAPALAAGSADNDTAIWIALGAVFLGALTTIGGALLALATRKKKKAAEQD